MGASLAFLICSIGVAGLFYLDRDKSVRNSKALWLPVIWLWIAGSRPVSAWLGIGRRVRGLLSPQHSTGVPWTRLFLGCSSLAGVVVLFQRRIRQMLYSKRAARYVI